MTNTLEKAFEAAKTLPADRQEQIGQWISDYVAQEKSTLALSAEQKEALERRIADPNPVYATDEQVAALFRKFAV